MRGSDWAEKLSSWAVSGRQASRAMEKLAAELRDLRVPAVPVEDGGNRDTDTWTVPRWDAQLSLSRSKDTQDRRDRLSSGVPVPVVWWDGTRWRTLLYGQRSHRYVPQGHP